MLKLKNVFLFFIIATVVCSLARTFALVYTTEASTGFFIHRMSSIGILLMIFIAVTVLCLFALAFSLKIKLKAHLSSSFYVGAASVALGAAIIIDMLCSLNYSYNVFYQFSLRFIFGLISAAVFIIYGICNFKKFDFPKIIFAFPTVFLIFQTIEIFTSYATLSLIAEHLFDIAVFCTLLVFFLLFGKAMNGLEINSRLTAALGFCSSLLALTSFISRTATVFAGCADRLHGETPLPLSVFFFGVFIFIWTVQNFSDIKN